MALKLPVFNVALPVASTAINWVAPPFTLYPTDVFGVAVKVIAVDVPEQIVVAPEMPTVIGGRTVITTWSEIIGQLPSPLAVTVRVTEPPAVEIPLLNV